MEATPPTPDQPVEPAQTPGAPATDPAAPASPATSPPPTTAPAAPGAPPEVTPAGADAAGAEAQDGEGPPSPPPVTLEVIVIADAEVLALLEGAGGPAHVRLTKNTEGKTEATVSAQVDPAALTTCPICQNEFVPGEPSPPAPTPAQPEFPPETAASAPAGLTDTEAAEATPPA